ncbi:hypothetical protein RJ639_002660 [Escallonia herrerae]|uniref:Uncharacterized protein n=1 Tax=Escallonia herrerae TaxID=1293975 RepID=A0AA88XIF8_9ASTE|nr:hypothetical protein RJ639_002660 [Escallonia herrerae]
MDTKALAKSKRAHSQHHSKKHHPNPASKPPPVGSAGATATKKPAGKQIKEKPRLPSNWDRYEEEFDSGTEIPVEGSGTVSRHSDVVVPKSKGADYRFLVSEAKSQMGSSSDVFPAFDDVFTDFNQGLGALLSVRGKSTLSWTEGGNFLVENKATASNEVPFLSLNLHALAEQLSKVDLAQRLFIEADLLSPETYTGELQQASWKQGSCQDQATCGSMDAKKDSDELASSYLVDRNRQAIQPFEVTSSDNTITSSHPVPEIGNENSNSMNHDEDGLWEVGRAGKMLEPAAEIDTGVANHRFEAAAAEAELDMLLDSFNERKFLGISGVTSYVSQGQASTSMSGGISSDQLLTQDPGSSKPALAAALDDTIDDLLNETLPSIKMVHHSSIM